jgi:hypothetical protein
MTHERRVIFSTMLYQRDKLLARPSGDIYSGPGRATEARSSYPKLQA